MGGKEYDVEAASAGTTTTARSLPRFSFFRRKRVLTALCIVPMLLLVYMYARMPSSLMLSQYTAPQATPEATTTTTTTTTTAAVLTEAVPVINDLAGQSAAVNAVQSESILLLLQALKGGESYHVGADWQDIFIKRTPVNAGLMGTINSAATNRFTDLLFRVGLPPGSASGVKSDALQLYRLSRTEWASSLRNNTALTVFSKSYCPYSKRAKALLTSLHANYTTYEVDLRPDAHFLQPLLAAITLHSTFPTILVQDRVLGGADDLAALHHSHQLEPLLASIGAL